MKLATTFLAAGMALVPALSFGSLTGNWWEDVGTELNEIKGPFQPRSAVPGDGFSTACKLGVLERLGWKVSMGTTGSQITAIGGNPCLRVSLAATHQNGELKLDVPAVVDSAEIDQVASQLLSSDASMCGYKFLVADSAPVAAARLANNAGFDFDWGGFPFIDFEGSALWARACPDGGCFSPVGDPAGGLSLFDGGSVKSDCAVGSQMVEYELERVLYGDLLMNQSFHSDEIVIGTWPDVDHSNSATWGNMTPEDSTTDKEAAQLSLQGAYAMIGFSGYLGNVLGETYLDSPVDRGENYFIIGMSQQAARNLASRGGFGAYNDLNRQAWQLSQGLSIAEKRMTIDGTDLSHAGLSDGDREKVEQIRQILADPFYPQTLTYVHHLGELTFAQHVERLMEINPRTPYAFQLYPSRQNKALFERFVQLLLRNCGETRRNVW